MAVLVIADVQGQTAEGYDGMLAALEADMKDAPGFIAHGAGPSAELTEELFHAPPTAVRQCRAKQA